MLAGQAREISDSFTIRTVARCAGGDSPVRQAFVEQLLALRYQCGVISSAGRRRLSSVVSGDPVNDLLIKLARDTPHEVVGVLLRARLFPERVDLSRQIARTLRSKDGKLRRRANPTRPVTGRAKIDGLFLGRLLDIGRNGLGTQERRSAHKKCEDWGTNVLHRQLLLAEC